MFLIGGAACTSNKNNQSASHEKTEVSTPTDAGTVTLTVEGMTCTGCENTLKAKLSTVNGVSKVDASHETGKVVVAMSKEALNSDEAPQLDLAKAVEDAGYTVASIEVVKTN